MIQRILAIWSASSAFSKSSLYIWKFLLHIKSSLKDFSITLLVCEMSAICSRLLYPSIFKSVICCCSYVLIWRRDTNYKRSFFLLFSNHLPFPLYITYAWFSICPWIRQPYLTFRKPMHLFLKIEVCEYGFGNAEKLVEIMSRNIVGFCGKGIRLWGHWFVLTSFAIIGSFSDHQYSNLLSGIGDVYPIGLLWRFNEVICVMHLAQCWMCRFSKFWTC